MSFEPNARAAIALLEGNEEIATHGRAVARIAVRIAAAIGLDEPTQARIGTAAGLHDIGKLPISPETLAKPGALTPDEWAQVRLHPVLGEQMLFSEGLAEIAGWVRCHHERPDGRGYPDGLATGAIPLESLIIAVADAYDAMVSERPYSSALSDSAAREELLRAAGTQFDSKIVGAFLGLRFHRRSWHQTAPAGSFHAVA
jgi:HD-GYP domain-containing protein (c-di-GMP phosphodiesterase class II)